MVGMGWVGVEKAGIGIAPIRNLRFRCSIRNRRKPRFGISDSESGRRPRFGICGAGFGIWGGRIRNLARLGIWEVGNTPPV